MLPFFDPVYLMIVGPALLLSIIAQIKVKSTFARYSQVGTAGGMSGAEAARRILDSFGLGQVQIEEVGGFLTDHYDPRTRVLRLSPKVYQGRSIASIGVAAHETGHALQHAQGYFAMQIRAFLVPVTQIGSMAAWPLLFLGFILGALSLVKLGILLFSAVVLFQIVTLPVEFDASRRAVAILGQRGMLTQTELGGTRSVLNAAALTYVAAAAAAVLQLLYFLMRAGLLGGRRD
jgi:uncharacterized protein